MEVFLETFEVAALVYCMRVLGAEVTRR